jgi:hypothetical protein
MRWGEGRWCWASGDGLAPLPSARAVPPPTSSTPSKSIHPTHPRVPWACCMSAFAPAVPTAPPALAPLPPPFPALHAAPPPPNGCASWVPAFGWVHARVALGGNASTPHALPRHGGMGGGGKWVRMGACMGGWHDADHHPPPHHPPTPDGTMPLPRGACPHPPGHTLTAPWTAGLPPPCRKAAWWDGCGGA